MQETQKVLNNPLCEIGSFKDRLKNGFFQNELIRELVMPNRDDSTFSWEDNWVGGKHTVFNPDGTIKKTATLIGHCFDVPYIDETIDTEMAVICVETNPIEFTNTTLKKIRISICIYVHHGFTQLESNLKQIYVNDYGLSGNRIDMIAMAINSYLMNKEVTQKFGIGNLKQLPWGKSLINSKFYGRVLEYDADCIYFTSKLKKQVIL